MDVHITNSFIEALLSFDKKRAQSIAFDCIGTKEDLAPFFELVRSSLDKIGEGWSKGQIPLAQEYIASTICEELLSQLLPDHKKVLTDNTFIGITNIDDYHLLGKRIVSSVVQSSGYKIKEFDPQNDISVLASHIVESRIRILLVSALMLHTAKKIERLRKSLDILGSDVKIIVGGAPFNFDSKLWCDVGANAMGRSPWDAVAFINQFKDNIQK